MNTRPLVALIACSTLIACDSAIPPTRTAADLTAASAEFDRLAAITDTITAPPGTADFSGEIASEVIVDGETGGVFLGALDMSVDFDNPTSGITGSIQDITLFDEGEPDQNLGGSLTVAGGFDSTLTATATGSLTAVEESGAFGVSGDAVVALNLTGSLVDDAGTDTLVGNVTGGSTGDAGDFDILLTGENAFYARGQ